MKLTKAAKESLEFGVTKVESYLGVGFSPSEALKKLGVKGLEDTTYFLAYLKESGHGSLLKRLTQDSV